LVKDGRFGPYVTDGTTNASLRKGDTVDGITTERAAELLSDRRSAPPRPGRSAGGRKKAGSAKKAAPAKKAASASKSSAATKRVPTVKGKATAKKAAEVKTKKAGG
jgi:DNA topoisomerase-1